MFLRREYLVGDASNVAALVVQVFDDLEFSLGDLRERSSCGERHYAFPEIDSGCRPCAGQCLRKIDATTTKERLSGICKHAPEDTACWN